MKKQIREIILPEGMKLEDVGNGKYKVVQAENNLPTKVEDLGLLDDNLIASVDTGRIIKQPYNYKYTHYSEQNAEAEAAMRILLRFRREWLDVEAPGWEPDWINDSQSKYAIYRYNSQMKVDRRLCDYEIFSFPTEELAEKFRDTFTRLLTQAFSMK